MRDTLGNCGEGDLIMLLDFDLLRHPSPGEIGTWMDLLRGRQQGHRPGSGTPVAKLTQSAFGCDRCKHIGWYVMSMPDGTFAVTDCGNCRAYRDYTVAVAAAAGDGVPCDVTNGRLLHLGSGTPVQSQALVTPPAGGGHITDENGNVILHRRLYLEVNIEGTDGLRISDKVNEKVLNRLVAWQPFGQRRQVIIKEVKIVDHLGQVQGPSASAKPKRRVVKHTRSIQID